MRHQPLVALAALLLLAVPSSRACLYNTTHCQCSVGHVTGVCLHYQSGSGSTTTCIAETCSGGGFKCDCDGIDICLLETCGISWQPTILAALVVGQTYSCEQTTDGAGSPAAGGICVRPPTTNEQLLPSPSSSGSVVEGSVGPSPTPTTYGVLCNDAAGVCCNPSCSTCGDAGCGNDIFGDYIQSIADICCAAPIFSAGLQCGANPAPCVIPGASATPSPTSGASATPTPYGAMCNEAAGVCCAASCYTCADIGCEFDINNLFDQATADNCCAEHIHPQQRECHLYAPPCTIPGHSTSPSPIP